MLARRLLALLAGAFRTTAQHTCQSSHALTASTLYRQNDVGLGMDSAAALEIHDRLSASWVVAQAPGSRSSPLILHVGRGNLRVGLVLSCSETVESLVAVMTCLPRYSGWFRCLNISNLRWIAL